MIPAMPESFIRDAIAARLEKLGISQHELARRSGVHISVINRFLCGHSESDSSTIEKLVDALGGAKLVWGRRPRERS